MIDNNVLEKVESTKFLGVFVDCKLNWATHVSNVSQKISKGLGILSRLRNTLPPNILLTFYYTLIYPYLNYCTLVWGCAGSSILNKVLVLQKRAVRVITSSPYCSESSPLFFRLHILKVSDTYKLQVAMLMFKVKYKLLPLSCMHHFKINLQGVYNIRQYRYFENIAFRTNIRERAIAIYGPRLWNSLAQSIQSCPSQILFRRQFVTSIFSEY